MNKKSLLLVFIVCVLILFALILRNGKLLLLAMPFLVYLIVGLVQAPTDMALLAKRTLDKPSVIAQETVATRIVIKNEGNALVNLSLNDSLYPSMTILEGQARQRLSLSSGETAELNYTFNAARGVYSWNTVHARASDPFGLFELEREISAFGEILFRPAPMKIRPVNGVAADLSSSLVIFGATFIHLPVSTTHVISSSILGVGASHRVKGVKWGTAQRMLITWVITLPISASLAALFYYLLHFIF